MAKITAPVKGFKGKVAGVVFEDGYGETDNDNAIAYFRRKGYGIGNTKPSGTGAGKDAPDPADPREVAQTRVGTPVRDGAVDPEPGDFLGPTNAGEANPHGPDVVNPEVHASQGVRPVKGGPVHVDDADVQDAAETDHTRVATSGEPLPEVDPSAYGEDSEPIPPAGNASREDWAAYATALGEDPGDRGRDELRETYGPKA